LLTNIPIQDVATAKCIYTDWRLRSRLEHGYRFDQEQGLDVQFVFVIANYRPRQAAFWLQKLGGKFGLKTDRNGPYIFCVA